MTRWSAVTFVTSSTQCIITHLSTIPSRTGFVSLHIMNMKPCIFHLMILTLSRHPSCDNHDNWVAVCQLMRTEHTRLPPGQLAAKWQPKDFLSQYFVNSHDLNRFRIHLAIEELLDIIRLRSCHGNVLVPICFSDILGNACFILLSYVEKQYSICITISQA